MSAMRCLWTGACACGAGLGGRGSFLARSEAGNSSRDLGLFRGAPKGVK